MVFLSTFHGDKREVFDVQYKVSRPKGRLQRGTGRNWRPHCLRGKNPPWPHDRLFFAWWYWRIFLRAPKCVCGRRSDTPLVELTARPRPTAGVWRGLAAPPQNPTHALRLRLCAFRPFGPQSAALRAIILQLWEDQSRSSWGFAPLSWPKLNA